MGIMKVTNAPQYLALMKLEEPYSYSFARDVVANIRLMENPAQEWMIKMEQWLQGLAGEWRGTKTTVLDETAAIGERLDRIEKKLDEALAELRQLRKS